MYISTSSMYLSTYIKHKRDTIMNYLNVKYTIRSYSTLKQRLGYSKTTIFKRTKSFLKVTQNAKYITGTENQRACSTHPFYNLHLPSCLFLFLFMFFFSIIVCLPLPPFNFLSVIFTNVLFFPLCFFFFYYRLSSSSSF